MSQSFSDLGLIAELARSVADEGYTVPTPIQAQAIPVILAGDDVLAAAQTGTGKTAGFTLPLLQRLHAAPLSHRAPRTARALVLTPTRELAAQVEEAIRTYGRHLELSSALIFGGVGINPQIDAMKRGVDILVATPGRLLDHLQQKTVDLGKVEVLVLDEADRMLDMGFIRDIRRILAILPKQRQNLLFSATFSDEIRGLANGLLNSPAMIEVARRNVESELVAQRIHPVDASRKRALLSHLIGRGDWRQVLVFTRTKHGANRLAEQLAQDGISASAIHGNKSQSARTKALASFKQGSIRVLVATDIAARGLDIEELPHVVNYELPNVPHDYVHRIGRTGRAGNNGEAISLVAADENAYLADIERLIKRRVERELIAGFEPGTAASAVPPAEPRRQQAQPAGRSGQREGKPRTPAQKPLRQSNPAATPAVAPKVAGRVGQPAPRRDHRRQTPALLGTQPRRAG